MDYFVAGSTFVVADLVYTMALHLRRDARRGTGGMLRELPSRNGAGFCGV